MAGIVIELEDGMLVSVKTTEGMEVYLLDHDAKEVEDWSAESEVDAGYVGQIARRLGNERGAMVTRPDDHDDTYVS